MRKIVDFSRYREIKNVGFWWILRDFTKKPHTRRQKKTEINRKIKKNEDILRKIKRRINNPPSKKHLKVE